MYQNKHIPNNAIAVALLSNGRGEALVIQSNRELDATLTSEETARIERAARISQLKRLVYNMRIPNLDAGFHHARVFGYMGGEDFDNAVEVLEHARDSKEHWELALQCFNQFSV